MVQHRAARYILHQQRFCHAILAKLQTLAKVENSLLVMFYKIQTQQIRIGFRPFVSEVQCSFFTHQLAQKKTSFPGHLVSETISQTSEHSAQGFQLLYTTIIAHHRHHS